MATELDDLVQQLYNRGMGFTLRTDLLSVLNGVENTRDFLLYEPPTAEGRESVLQLVRLLKQISQSDEQRATHLAEVNTLLSPCLFHPQAALNAKGELVVKDRVVPGSENSVHAAMRALVLLIREGHLALLKQCECGTWFLAKRNGQNSCTPRCYQRRFQATDSAKASRRAYDEKVRTGAVKVQAKKAAKKVRDGKA